ncbi:MAG: sugar phosphate isomerase/epimerase [Acidobacteria bacterium]|nr:MAG: sugar phosphate isomerase/epimerase [Acidobacteriota bacterium]
MVLTRRSVMKAAALGAACNAIRPLTSFAVEPSAGDDKQFHGLRVGLCSYSLRSFPLAEALQDIRRLGVHYLSLKEVHLPLNSMPDQRKQVRQQAADLGLSITSCGVIYLKDAEGDMRQAFDYVRDLGASVAVVGVTRDQLPTLDKVIRDYDLKAAIHNHGPNDKRFPSPLEVYDAIKGLDRKIGVCMDIGHTFRMHEDLVSDLKKTNDRLYSMHFKDLESDHVDAKGLPVGTGVLPIIPVLRELVRSGYTGEVQLEYEIEPKDPLPGAAESLGFMRGALQNMS